MGFSTGRSKAKREAKKAAAKAYWKAFKGLNRIDGAQSRNIDVRGTKAIEEEMGDDLSYGSKRLAMQADKVGKDVNKHLPKFKQSVENYNKRYDILQRQMKGETVTGNFEVNKKKDQSFSGMASILNTLNKKEAPLFSGTTKEEAVAFAKAQEAADREKARSNPFSWSNYSRSPTSSTIQNALSNFQNKDSQFGDYSVTQQRFDPISSNYRQLGAAKAAGEDLEALSKDLNGQSEYTNAAKKYGELAEKLKTKLRRDVGSNVKPVMVEPGEIISGNAGPITGETIG
jgi:hypothetical protein